MNMLRAIFEEKGKNEFHCAEVSRALQMDIPVAMVVKMPSTYTSVGNTHILLYFPTGSNIVVYSTELLNHKFTIEKIADINYYADEREKINLYKYVVELLPFLKPIEDGLYSYFIDFSTVGSRFIEVRIKFYNDHDRRSEESLELWYYDDMIGRCKKPQKLGMWVYKKHEINDKNVLVWETKDGKPLDKKLRLPHINGYHEYDEGVEE